MSSKQPLVSVIIPAYNDAPYIKDAIESVLQQDFQNFEIIVVDDGSTDNTKEILSPYIRDGEIRYFYQENQGVSAARNRGILEATGEYISFLDADDLYCKDALKNRVNFIVRFNLKFISTDLYIVESDNEIKNLLSLCPVSQKKNFLKYFETVDNKDYLIVDKEKFAYVYLKNEPPLFTTILVKRNFLIKNKIFFDRRLHRAEDKDFIWKIISSSEIKLIGILNKPTYIYMFNRATHYKRRRLEERLIYYDNLIKAIQNILPKKSIAERLYTDYWVMYKNATFKLRINLLKKILSVYPFDLKYWKSFLVLWLKRIFKGGENFIF